MKKRAWSSCPNMVAVTATDGSVQMTWLGTHSMCCSHLLSFRLSEACFWTTEQKEARDKTSAVAPW